MNKALRRPIIAGNWKMNKTPSEVEVFAMGFLSGLSGWEAEPAAEAVICAPAIDLCLCCICFEGTPVQLGGQNLYPAESGAFTGEISPAMLRDTDCEYVILGHSERRAMGETDSFIAQKITAALAAGLTPIVCVGESLEIRDAGEAEAFLTRQAGSVLDALDARSAAGVVLAYEPIWAIGTGRTAAPEQAQEICALLRRIVGDRFGADTADRIRILYGGSMNEKNAAELLAQPDIDGGLIGGASLVPEKLLAILKAAE